MGDEGKWVEVQIRSKRMDEIAEKGYAAHWHYKNQGIKANSLDLWIYKIRLNEKPNLLFKLASGSIPKYEFKDDR